MTDIPELVSKTPRTDALALSRELFQIGLTYPLAFAFIQEQTRELKQAAAALSEQKERIAELERIIREYHQTFRENAERIAVLRGTLQELRVRYHAAGRRPEECYEMSLIDAALGAQP